MVIDIGRPGRLTTAAVRAALAAPDPVDGFASRRYRVGGVDLHVRERPGQSPAYLLLHGLAVSHRYLMPTAWLAEAAARTPAARTMAIPQAAHNVVTTAGAEVARAICQYGSAVGP